MKRLLGTIFILSFVALTLIQQAVAQPLVVLQTNEPRTLSPDFAADTGGYGPTSNIYSHLVTMDWGVSVGTAAYGDLAKSWTVSDDGLRARQ